MITTIDEWLLKWNGRRHSNKQDIIHALCDLVTVVKELEDKL